MAHAGNQSESPEEVAAVAALFGTVDRFQGQEAPIVVYSMATSSAEEAPRGMASSTTPTA